MLDDLWKAALEGVVKDAGIKPEQVADVKVGNVRLDGACGPHEWHNFVMDSL